MMISIDQMSRDGLGKLRKYKSYGLFMLLMLCPFPCRPFILAAIQCNFTRKSPKSKAGNLWTRVRSIKRTWASPTVSAFVEWLSFYILDSLACFFFFVFFYKKKKDTQSRNWPFSCFSISSPVSLKLATFFGANQSVVSI